MRRSLMSAALVTILTGVCTQVPGSTETSTPPTTTVVPTTPSPVPPGPTTTERILVYEALIRGLVGLERGFDASGLAIRREICKNASHLIGKDERCPDAFSEAEQGMLSDLLETGGRDVIFVESFEDLGPDPYEAGIYAWVGLLQVDGDDYWVEGGMWCGVLCGHGGTYVLKQGENGWRMAGNAPGTMSWIS
jgi:hypothetical protein